jgi:hypothetical protein
VSIRPTLRAWNAFDRVLALAALAAGALIALRAPGMGDYPSDAGPALSAIAHGSIAGFFSHQPAMGAVSLYVRAPFVILAAAFHDAPVALYRWGDVPCVLSVALVATWMARVAGRRGTGPVGRALIVALCLINPLLSNALYLGHPEELLTASLAVGSLLAACDRRVLLAAVLGGLAVASKQWALLIVCPVLLTLERERIRAGVVMLSTAAASTLPMVVANFASFRHAVAYISTPQPVATLFSWLYPLSRTHTIRFSLIFGHAHVLTVRSDHGIETAFSHPLIIVLGFAVPLLVWYRRGRHLSAEDVVLSAAVVFLLRCTLDPGSWPYYHFPLLLALVALDATAGRRLPLAGLTGVAGAFIVLDRFPTYFGDGAANLAYTVTTLLALALLVRELRSPARVRSAAGPRRWLAGSVSREVSTS